MSRGLPQPFPYLPAPPRAWFKAIGHTAQRRPLLPAMASQGHERLIASLGGSIVAESATVPIDTVKVRLQVQNTAAGPKAYKGMLDAFASIAKSEGASGLFKGFGPALLRQCSYTPLTMVLFEPIRGLLVAEGEKPSYVSVVPNPSPCPSQPCRCCPVCCPVHRPRVS